MTRVSKANRVSVPDAPLNRLDVIARAVPQFLVEVDHVRRALREIGADRDPIHALGSSQLERSPALNRARGFVCALALAVNIGVDDLLAELVRRSRVTDLSLTSIKDTYEDPVPF